MILAETAAAVLAWGIGVAPAKWETVWAHRNRNRNHKGLESEERTVTEISSCRPPGKAQHRAQSLAEGLAAWTAPARRFLGSAWGTGGAEGPSAPASRPFLKGAQGGSGMEPEPQRLDRGRKERSGEGSPGSQAWGNPRLHSVLRPLPPPSSNPDPSSALLPQPPMHSPRSHLVSSSVWWS